MMAMAICLAEWHAHGEDTEQKPCGLQEIFNPVQEMLQRQN